ncbi:expressed protein [Phakopsora pachyrhizi]|uniref:Expressed protein n=1 Tax=Phakopsora pachyrhizi TaxID=170000 RepID=A0AAV0BKH9_PHAPC|nr:expressed protein [Phakopsora pachyrhizi]
MQNELLLNYQGLINLDRWTDETKIDLMAKDIREHSSALLSLYYPEHQMFEGSSLPSSETGNHLQNLSRLSILESGMQSSRSSLLSSLHQKEFQKSGPHWIPKSGFYPCFCLVNPRVANCPIVLVSQNFSFSTGYQPYEMIGKTIHILRKSSTNTDNTQFFQEKGNPEIELSVCLRKDGGGFYGYWVIEPLLDPCGKVMFYLVLIQDITLDLKILLSPFLNISSQESSQFQFSPRMTDNQSKEDATISSGPSISNSRRSGTSSLKRDLKTLKTKYIREWVNTNSTSLNSRLGHNPKNRTQFLNRRNSTSLSFTSVFSTRNKVDICKIEKPLVPASQSMILTRRDRSIMYISKRTLEFLGIPTESTTDVWNPPILQEDITKFLYSNSAQETNDIISLITELFYRGTSGKCRCIIRYKSNLNESENDAKGKKSSAEVGKWGEFTQKPASKYLKRELK